MSSDRNLELEKGPFSGRKVRDSMPQANVSIFSMTLEEFQRLPLDSRSDVFQSAYEHVKFFVDNVLDESGANWVILIGEDPEVHSVGTFDQNISSDELWALAGVYGVIPFQFYQLTASDQIAV